MAKENKPKPLWEQQIDEIMKKTYLPKREDDDEDEEAVVIRGIGIIIAEMKDLLKPEQVMQFMRMYHEESNDFAPDKRWRLFFEHMILELCQNYPLKETSILMFKAGQVFERHRNELQGGDDD